MTHVQGVQEKMCFFIIHCNPSLAYIAETFKCECTVTPIGRQFFIQPIAAVCWRGRGGKLLRILEKKQYSMNTLYVLRVSSTLLCVTHVPPVTPAAAWSRIAMHLGLVFFQNHSDISSGII